MNTPSDANDDASSSPTTIAIRSPLMLMRLSLGSEDPLVVALADAALLDILEGSMIHPTSSANEEPDTSRTLV